MDRITIDTNVYISALNYPKSKPYQLLQMAQDGDVHVAISESLMQEVLRIMRDKFHATPEDLKEAEEIITSSTERVSPTQTVDVVKDDPDDNRIVECAAASGSTAIVTGDKDLLRLKEVSGIKVVTVAEFLQLGIAR